MVTKGWLTSQERSETAFPKTVVRKGATKRGTSP